MSELLAHIETSSGKITVSLEFEKTPGTVGNFVALAEGQIENSVKNQGIPYYDGLKFHRVIPEFMIQGGCPLGTGNGNPGYQFDDEFHPDLKHDVPGILSMANAGPGTNGSQFFITHVDTPWLDGKHTVFGKVVKGMAVINAIGQDDQIKKITIERIGAAAKAFNAVEAFRTFEGSRVKRIEAERLAKLAQMDALAKGFEQTASGLRYQIIQKGSGKQAKSGDTVSVHYKGQLADGTIFDSSYKRYEPIDFILGQGQVIRGWDEGLALLSIGDKARFVIPSDLGYGARGAGGVIPPDAILVFDVELMDAKS